MIMLGEVIEEVSVDLEGEVWVGLTGGDPVDKDQVAVDLAKSARMEEQQIVGWVGGQCFTPP